MVEIFTLSPISDGGNYLNLIIGPGENIKITNRGNYGFDTSLPGRAILVEHQDTNNGDTGSNLVNTDSKNAWLKIIEADGDDALIRNKIQKRRRRFYGWRYFWKY